MSYFSPAVICYGPHTLQAGQSFTLRYRILVHPDRWDAEQLKREYQRFVQDGWCFLSRRRVTPDP
jgi:hypothetical protein